MSLEKEVVLYIATSLDGFIARADGRVDWLTPVEGEDFGYAEFLATIDTVVMGRTTYEQVLTFGPYPYEGKRSLVLSRTRRGSDRHVEFVGGDLDKLVTGLKEAGGSNIWLVGGAEVIDGFEQRGLIDRYIIAVVPRLLGGGIPLFRPDRPERRLILSGSRTFPQGIVQSTYIPAR